MTSDDPRGGEEVTIGQCFREFLKVGGVTQMNVIMLCVLTIGQSPPTADELRLLNQVAEFRARRMKEYDALIEKTADPKTRNKLKNSQKEFKKTGLMEVFYPRDFVTGRIGYLSGGYADASNRYAPDNSFRVFQVIDPLSMIVESPDDYTGITLDNVARNFKTVRFFVSGVSTKDVIDKSFVRLPQLFEITGTKTYTTVIGGSSTIYEIRPFPIQDYGAALKMLSEKLDGSEEAIPETPVESLRTFKDATGRFNVEARFSSYGSGSVTLERQDGSKVKVPLERLSEDDQKWIKEEIERRKNKR